MTSSTAVYALIVTGGLLTWAFRASFLIFADRLSRLDSRSRHALRLVAPAVLAALIAPALLRPEGELALWSPAVGAAVVTGAMVWWTRSAWLSLLSGLALFVLLSMWAG